MNAAERANMLEAEIGARMAMGWRPEIGNAGDCRVLGLLGKLEGMKGKRADDRCMVCEKILGILRGNHRVENGGT